MKKWFLSFLLIALIHCIPFSAMAAEPAKPSAAIEDEVVVTAERSSSLMSKTVRSVSIVSGQDIYQRLSRTVPEALRYEQGILIQRTGPGGGAPFIRGMAGNQILYMIDGIRLNNSTYRSGPNQYLNTIDPFFIDRIEVVRGPGSVLYGSDALGGAINVITFRRKDFSKSAGFDGRLMGRASSADLEQTGHLDFNVNGGSIFGLAVSGNLRKFGNITPGSNLPIQTLTDYEEQNFAGNFDFHFGSHVTVELAAHFANLDDVHNFDPINTVNLFEPQRRVLYYGKLHLKELSPYLNMITLFTSYQLQSEGRVKQVAVTLPTLRTETRDLDLVTTIGAGLQFESPIGQYARFVYGGEYYQDMINSERKIETLPTGKVDEIDPQFPDGSTYSSIAGYLEVAVTPTDWMIIVSGSRYSLFMPQIDMEDPTLGDVTVDDHFSDVSWTAHTLFNFAKYHGIILGLSRGFRAPGIDDFAKLGSEDGRYDIPNSELDPESIMQYELGYRVIHPLTYLSLFGYYSQISDLIARKPSQYNGNKFVGQDRVYQNENVGDAYNYGIEFSAGVSFFDDFFRAGGTASYTVGQNETDDEPMRRIPPVMGTAYSRINFDPIWLEWAMEAAAKQDRLSQGDKDDIRIGPDGSPGFDIHHLRLGIKAVDWLEAVMAVENITNEKYKYHGSGIYEPGRNYKMQVSFLF